MSLDVVGIYNANFQQVLAAARPMRASISPSAKIFEHPLENGSTINDHKIINPVELELVVVLDSADYKSTYQELQQLFTSNQLVTVQTRANDYGNMTIVKLPHEETADVADTIIVSINFKQAFFATAVYGPLPASMVRDPNQASTINRGEQLPGDADEATNSQGSFLYRQFIQ